jgi:hypothetical protein
MRGKPDREGGGAPARFGYSVSSLRLTALAGWRMPAPRAVIEAGELLTPHAGSQAPGA